MSEDPQLIDKSCPVRPCVIERDLENCAHCADFRCEKLTERLVTIESVEERFGVRIPLEDRDRFIAPYENLLRLEKLRARLDQGYEDRID